MGEGVFDREFTKSLIIHDFDDVLKNPFRCVHLCLLHTLLSKDNYEYRHTWPVTEGPKLLCYTPSPIERGSYPYKVKFLDQPVLLIRNTWNLENV